jgi:hypothetical protein
MEKGKRIRAEQGSGNVFADLDLPHAEQELLKARLTLRYTRSSKTAASPRPRQVKSLASSSRTSRR